jgi:hypothetical protein
VNEEVAVVKPVPEEEQTSVEVGFDICGTDLEPELLADQGKPRCITPFYSFYKIFIHFKSCEMCIK